MKRADRGMVARQVGGSYLNPGTRITPPIVDSGEPGVYDEQKANGLLGFLDNLTLTHDNSDMSSRLKRCSLIGNAARILIRELFLRFYHHHMYVKHV